MLETTAKIIDGLIGAIGRATALFIPAVIALILYEVTARAVFNVSTPWAGDVSEWLLAAMVFLGGPYALIRGNFVRVDLFFAKMTPRTRAWMDTLVSTALMAAFCAVLVILGGNYFWNSFESGEVSATGSWSGPVWLAKSFVPASGVLLGLGWVSHLIRVWQSVLGPRGHAGPKPTQAAGRREHG